MSSIRCSRCSKQVPEIIEKCPNCSNPIKPLNIAQKLKLLKERKTIWKKKQPSDLNIDVVESIIGQTDGRRKRQGLTREVRNSVWRRDEGRCVECGLKENLEYDHIIPHSKGGSDTERNIQLLCMQCNRTKHASI